MGLLSILGVRTVPISDEQMCLVCGSCKRFVLGEKPGPWRQKQAHFSSVRMMTALPDVAIIPPLLGDAPELPPRIHRASALRGRKKRHSGIPTTLECKD